MQLTIIDAVLGVGLLIAAITDAREGKIYNALTLPLVVLGLAINAVAGDVAASIAGFSVAFGLHFTLYIMHVEKPGDAKLMLGVGALAGWSMVLESTLWMFLLLLPVGLTVLALRGKLGNFIATLRFVVLKVMGYAVEAPIEKTMLAFGPVIAVAVVVARFTDWLRLW